MRKRSKVINRVEAVIRKEGYTVEHKDVRLSEIYENAWNPNVQEAIVFSKLKNSITEFGFIDPILVRKRTGGGYEIIDGAYRFRAMKELESKEISVTCIREPVSDGKAQALTLICNKLKGTHDVLMEAKMLAELVAKEPALFDESAGMMPYTKQETEMMVELLRFDPKRYDDAQLPKDDNEAEELTKFVKGLIRLENAGHEYQKNIHDPQARRLLEEFSKLVAGFKQLSKGNVKQSKKH